VYQKQYFGIDSRSLCGKLQLSSFITEEKFEIKYGGREQNKREL